MHFSLFVPFNRVGETVACARLIPSDSNHVSVTNVTCQLKFGHFLVTCVTSVEIVVPAQCNMGQETFWNLTKASQKVGHRTGGKTRPMFFFVLFTKVK